jgi:hypothetical protein
VELSLLNETRVMNKGTRAHIKKKLLQVDMVQRHLTETLIYTGFLTIQTEIYKIKPMELLGADKSYLTINLGMSQQTALFQSLVSRILLELLTMSGTESSSSAQSSSPAQKPYSKPRRYVSVGLPVTRSTARNIVICRLRYCR